MNALDVGIVLVGAVSTIVAASAASTGDVIIWKALVGFLIIPLLLLFMAVLIAAVWFG